MAAELTPSSIRERVLADHRALRGRMASLEDSLDALMAGQLDVESLRVGTLELLTSLERHMHWEERYLFQALLDADAWGPERERRLEKDHAEQREVLTSFADSVDRLAPEALASRLRAFLKLLREDMESEELHVLDPDVLRDDVVGIDVEAG